MKKLLAVAATTLLLVSQQAHAFGATPAIIYTNLVWNVSGNAVPFSSCNQMILDASGNLNTTNKLVAYGALNCPNGTGYAATGTAYLANNGTFNLTITLAGGAQLVCGGLSTNSLSGTCTIVNSFGSVAGTAFISYVP